VGGVLNLTPMWVPVVAYAGDSATVNVVTNPPDYTNGGVWSAQVRSSPASTDILETFTVDPTAQGACLILDPEQTARLCDLGSVTRAQGCRVYQSFLGAWDVQVLFPSGSVQTLARGDFRVERDVTR
jgi:hypothetical protein